MNADNPQDPRPAGGRRRALTPAQERAQERAQEKARKKEEARARKQSRREEKSAQTGGPILPPETPETPETPDNQGTAVFPVAADDAAATQAAVEKPMPASAPEGDAATDSAAARGTAAGSARSASEESLALPGRSGGSGGRSSRGGRGADDGRRRPDAVVIAAIALPVLALVAALGVRVGAPPARSTAPDTVDRVSATVVCPSGGVSAGTEGDLNAIVPEQGTVRVGTATDASTSVQAQFGADVQDEQDVDLADGASVDLDSGAPVILTAEGDGAAGLIGTRFATGAGAAACGAPTTSAWFAGLGAGADRSSVIELTNPDSGTAVATLSLYDADGAVVADSIASVVVESGDVRRLDLSALTPTAGELGLHVDVTRGRLGVAVLQSTDPLDGDAGGDYWVEPVASAARSTTLLGLPGDEDTARTLVLLNPSEETVQATVQVIGTAGAYEPTDLDPIVIEPGAVGTADLSGVIAAGLADGGSGAYGVRVEASQPVVAALRSGSGEAERTSVVATATPAQTSDGRMAALLPDGADGQVVVTNADSAETTVEVVASGADGSEISTSEQVLAAGATASVDLPDGAARIDLVPADADAVADVRAAIVLSGDNAGVLAFTPTVDRELRPTVRRDWS